MKRVFALCSLIFSLQSFAFEHECMAPVRAELKTYVSERLTRPGTTYENLMVSEEFLVLKGVSYVSLNADLNFTLEDQTPWSGKVILLVSVDTVNCKINFAQDENDMNGVSLSEI